MYYPVAAATVATGADFVIRCYMSHSFKIVQDFIERGAADEIATGDGRHSLGAYFR